MEELTICVRKVKDPSCFWGVEVGNCSNSSKDFNLLQDEINSYFKDDQFIKTVLFNPSEGMRCIARINDTSWCRGRIEAMVMTPSTYKVRCFLVDRVSTVHVPTTRVYVAPPWVWEVPSQGIRFTLHGVVPVTLQTDYSNDTVNSISGWKWDSSAIQYFNKLIDSDKKVVSVEVVERSEDDICSVRMYIKDKIKGSFLCVNDMLVKEKFAMSEEQTLNSNSTNKAHSSHFDSVKKRDTMEVVQSQDIELFNQQQEESLDAFDIESVTESHHFNLNVSRSSSSGQSSSTLCSNGQDVTSGNFRPNRRDSSFSNSSFNSCVSENSEKSLKHGANSSSERRASIESSQSLSDILNSSLKSECNGFETPVSVGRGRMLNAVSSLCKNLTRSRSPPDIQRKIIHHSINDFSASGSENSLPTAKICNLTVDQNDPNIAEENFNHTVTNTNSNLPGPISVGNSGTAIYSGKHSSGLKGSEVAKQMLAELKKEKNSANQLPTLPTGIGRGTPLSRKLHQSKTSLQDHQESQQRKSEVLPTKKKNSSLDLSKQINKEEAFFVSKISLIKNSNNSGCLLVSGLNIPNPIPLFCNAPFPTFVLDTLQKLRYRGPYVLQAHAWSAILSKRNVIALGPPNSGKTLAYVAPIVSMLHQKLKVENESSRYSSPNPSCIVLCSTWLNVKKVVDCFESFHSPADTKHRVIGLSGGEEMEDANVGNLFTGCNVLVCSPCSLVRIYKKKYVDFSRLQQLVLDDVHILVEDFTSEISEIVKLWLETLIDPDRSLNLPKKPQFLCFGIQWTVGVERFMQTFMKKPLLYISNPLEAAVYGEVKHEIRFLPTSSKFDYFNALLQTYRRTKRAVAVFVKTVDAMKDVVDSLNSLSVYCVEVHSYMHEVELESIQKMFDEDNPPVLVVCDDALSLVDIDTIEVAIHYEVPVDGHTLGLRLSLMRSFYRIEKKNSEIALKSRSHILVTSEDHASSIWLIALLSRLSQPVPPELRHLAKLSAERTELNKLTKPLCPFLQAYGKCRDEGWCVRRHWLSRKLDRPNSDPAYAEIPVSGHVRVRVTFVKNAGYFYVRLLKHRKSPQDDPYVYPPVYATLCEQMNKFYSKEDSCLKLESSPNPGQLVAIKISKQFYRARSILTKSNKNQNKSTVCWTTPAGVVKTSVQLVDTGAIRRVPLETLYELPQQFISLPFQAVVVRLCNVRPVDQDIEWLFQTTLMIHEKIFEKEIEGNIVLALGQTMWLRPVVIRSKLPRTEIVVTDCNVGTELLRSGSAVKCPDHITNLVAKCKESGIPLHNIPEKSGNSDEKATNDCEGSKIRSRSFKGNVTNSSDSTTSSSVSVVSFRSPSTSTKLDKSHLKQSINDQVAHSNNNSRCPSTIDPSRRNSSHSSSQDADEEGSVSESDSDSHVFTKMHKTRISSSRLPHAASQPSVAVRPEPKRALPDLAKLTEHKKEAAQSSSRFKNPSPSNDYLQTPTSLSSLKEPLCDDAKTPTNFFGKNSYERSPGDAMPSLCVSSKSPPRSDSASSIRKARHVQNTPTVTRNGDESLSGYPRHHPSATSNSNFHSKHGRSDDIVNNRATNDAMTISLPPRSDVNCDGLLYPCCVKFMYCEIPSKRIAILEDIYITSAECYMYVTERDLQGLYKALMVTKNDDEAKLLAGVFLTLAHWRLPVKNYISLPAIVKKTCLGSHKLLYNLPHSVLATCIILLDELLENRNNQDETKELFRTLMTYLDQLTLNRTLDQEKIRPVIKFILLILDKITSIYHEVNIEAKDNGLIDVLSRMKSNEETDPVRKSLFVKLLGECIREPEVAEDEKPAQRSTVQERKPFKKVYDPLNYDRFNVIDTDSDTDSVQSYRPYIPVPALFDSETETCTTETDTDTEFLLGI